MQPQAAYPMREQRWYVFSLSSQPLARIVVTADFFLTATAVIAQPITGSLLALQAGYSLREGWIVRSIGLYLFLASGCLDANALAGFGFGSGRQRRSTSGRVSPHLLALVRLRRPRIRRRRNHILVDGRSSPNHGLMQSDTDFVPKTPEPYVAEGQMSGTYSFRRR
jgi:hypothetical protein